MRRPGETFEDTLNRIARDYPHECPRCGAYAYIGLNRVDCWERCDRSPSDGAEQCSIASP